MRKRRAQVILVIINFLLLMGMLTLSFSIILSHPPENRLFAAIVTIALQFPGIYALNYIIASLITRIGSTEEWEELSCRDRSVAFLEVIGLMLPRRIYLEEIGHGIEQIEKIHMSETGADWKIRVKVHATLFWSLINLLVLYISSLRGSSRPVNRE